MVGIYLSGTGNTKHCIEKLLHLLDETALAIPIEKEEAVCYRCISSCPKQAITLLGNVVVEQCRYDRYIKG